MTHNIILLTAVWSKSTLYDVSVTRPMANYGVWLIIWLPVICYGIHLTADCRFMFITFWIYFSFDSVMMKIVRFWYCAFEGKM